MNRSKRRDVAIYARISEDPTGQAAGVGRQLEDARRLAEREGWTVVAEHADNDVSALRGKRRPGYLALLDDVRAERVQAVIAYQTSRLWRNRAERAEGIDLFGRHRVAVVAVQGQWLDLDTAAGRGIAGVLGEMDTWESEVKSERVAAAARSRADQGKPNGAVPYGYWRERIRDDSGRLLAATEVPHEEEAKIVREIIDRLLVGESLHAITRDLNERGVPSPGAAHKPRHRERGRMNPTGALWGRSSVKKLALRESSVGIRVYHRGRPDEKVIENAWPAIVDRTKWERVRAMLTHEQRKRTNPGARKYLLTGAVGACGVCGGALRAKRMKPRVETQAVQELYVCNENQCVGRNMGKVDHLVGEVVIARLGQPDAMDWLVGDDEKAKAAQDRAGEIRARLDVAADQYADGKINASQLERITARLTPQIEEAEAERDREMAHFDMSLIADIAGPRARDAWESAPVTTRQEILKALDIRVRIMPAGRGPVFRPETVKINWGAA